MECLSKNMHIANKPTDKSMFCIRKNQVKLSILTFLKPWMALQNAKLFDSHREAIMELHAKYFTIRDLIPINIRWSNHCLISDYFVSYHNISISNSRIDIVLRLATRSIAALSQHLSHFTVIDTSIWSLGLQWPLLLTWFNLNLGIEK